MYVRDARKRDEAWLLDQIEALGLDDPAFRSRDYVIAVDEETDERAGFGRVREHDDGDAVAHEVTTLGVLERWRGQGVGAHVVERLVETAGAEGAETVYALTDTPEYLTQLGFEIVSTEALPAPIAEQAGEGDIPVAVGPDDVTVPDRLRERFKQAGGGEDQPDRHEEGPEDFGIDPDDATYKYDTG